MHAHSSHDDTRSHLMHLTPVAICTHHEQAKRKSATRSLYSALRSLSLVAIISRLDLLSSNEMQAQKTPLECTDGWKQHNVRTYIGSSKAHAVFIRAWRWAVGVWNDGISKHKRVSVASPPNSKQQEIGGCNVSWALGSDNTTADLPPEGDIQRSDEMCCRGLYNLSLNLHGMKASQC